MTTFSSQAADKDTFIYYGAPTTNYGANAQLQVGVAAAGVVRAILAWDLGFGIPFMVSKINSATLSLWVLADNQTAADTWRVYLLGGATQPNKGWVESEATWREYLSGTEWETYGGDYVTELGSTSVTASESVGTEIQFNLNVALIKSIINIQWSQGAWLSFLIKADAEGGGGYYALDSAEGATSAERPKLVIDYLPAVMCQVI